ncbi:tripartite tricarboxylate transporter TctB family protein [Cloacibacillus sp. An23]|uniref:tripartite tricarboxylate transporter TctB family protein n=1 Tax=Cloacibacillus sp. An23 TaxID=1965591 RepID=UPI000B37F6E5|nr:tripartite tricarboxylate transporter TctB family protein [Cloacibacillus sp. An23]OUO93182.1 hypothetical protein B5F39_07730 [Cloacibacillus sp. An23]
MRRVLASLFVPSLVLILSIAYYIESLKADNIDKLLIRPICILIVIFYIYFIAVEYMRWRKRTNYAEKASDVKKNLPYKELILLAFTALYILVIPHIGFVLTSILFMASTLYFLNVRSKEVILCFSIISSALIYAAFKVVLMVPLPSGPFGF